VCILCETQSILPVQQVASPKRRQWLKLAGAASLAAPLALGATSAIASQPPKPSNVLTPDQALERLMKGNERYVSGNTESVNFAKTRAALAGGQNPYACLLSCADSRIGPEYAFDEGRGDLFVTRVAGNFVNTDILASLEYGTAVLGAPLIMVLGHTSCGAIDATVKAVTQNASFPGHIQALTTALAPAVRQSQAAGAKDLLMAATLDNVRLNVLKLQQSNPILAERVAKGQLKVVGGLYHLDTGKVEMVS
jgi:carbonic anhydrase